jgi:hypothetical protein
VPGQQQTLAITILAMMHGRFEPVRIPWQEQTRWRQQDRIVKMISWYANARRRVEHQVQVLLA